MNFGHTEKVRLSDIAQRIIELSDSSSTIQYREKLPYVGFKGIPDIRRAKDRLGWFPLTPMDRGLEQTIEDLRASRVKTFESPENAS